MAKKIRSPKKKFRTSKDVTLPETPDPNAYRRQPCTLSFTHVHNRSQWRLSDHPRSDVKKFIGGLKEVCKHTWGELFDSGGQPYGGKVGSGYTSYAKGDLPDKYASAPSLLPGGMTVGSLRASKKHRVIGGKSGTVFYVLWFEREHRKR